MGKRINPKRKIVQRSIGFEFWMIEFFNKYPEFKPDTYCREAVKEQIKYIAPEMIPDD